MCYAGHFQPSVRGLPNISGPGGFIPHQGRRLLQASSYFFSGITAGKYTLQHWANHPTSQGSLHSYYPTNQNSWADMGTLPEEVILLQEEMNKAMGTCLQPGCL